MTTIDLRRQLLRARAEVRVYGILMTAAAWIGVWAVSLYRARHPEAALVPAWFLFGLALCVSVIGFSAFRCADWARQVLAVACMLSGCAILFAGLGPYVFAGRYRDAHGGPVAVGETVAALALLAIGLRLNGPRAVVACRYLTGLAFDNETLVEALRQAALDQEDRVRDYAHRALDRLDRVGQSPKAGDLT